MHMNNNNNNNNNLFPSRLTKAQYTVNVWNNDITLLSPLYLILIIPMSEKGHDNEVVIDLSTLVVCHALGKREKIKNT